MESRTHLGNIAATSFRKIVCDERKAIDIINEYAEEKECTQENCGNSIASSIDWLEQFTNYAGNEVTVAYRKSKGGSMVEFIIENSYKKMIKHKEQLSLQINND